MENRNAGREAAPSASASRQAIASPAALAAHLGRDLSASAVDAGGWTNLHYAAAFGWPALARALLIDGTPVNARLKMDAEPLGPQVLNTLRRFGRHRFTRLRRTGATPLHIASAANAGEVVAFLLEGGADGDERESTSATPPHYAAAPAGGRYVLTTDEQRRAWGLPDLANGAAVPNTGRDTAPGEPGAAEGPDPVPVDPAEALDLLFEDDADPSGDAAAAKAVGDGGSGGAAGARQCGRTDPAPFVSLKHNHGPIPDDLRAAFGELCRQPRIDGLLRSIYALMEPLEQSAVPDLEAASREVEALRRREVRPDGSATGRRGPGGRAGGARRQDMLGDREAPAEARQGPRPARFLQHEDLAAGLDDSTDVHVHLAEAAPSKDGPSAGVTLAVALVSALTGRPARGDMAMTGELTLSGRVAPVAGIREKLLRAGRAGMTAVVLPAANEPDVAESFADGLPCGLGVRYAGTMDDVLAAALPDAVGGQGPVEVEQPTRRP